MDKIIESQATMIDDLYQRLGQVRKELENLIQVVGVHSVRLKDLEMPEYIKPDTCSCSNQHYED